ncbi:MAG: IS1595 family transposase [Myxococcales bacterium]|nr:IS1595 family transposase [Myxococcales bacterium]
MSAITTDNPLHAESGSFRIVDTLRPSPGVDYPQDALELLDRFGGESDCAALVERLRFPRGFVCPSCECRRTPWRSGTGLIACPECRAPTAVTERALFHGSRIMLTTWFRAIWRWLESDRLVTAEELRAWLDIRDERRAAIYLGQLRALLALDDDRPLRGEVVIAKATLAGPEGPSVVVAIEQKQAAGGRIRMQRLRRGNAGEILRFAAAVVAPGSLVVTPPWKGLSALRSMGFHHKHRTSSLGLPSAGDPQAIWAEARVWLGEPLPPEAELQGAIDELVFRHNRRDTEVGLRWHRVMALAVSYPRRLSAALRNVGT